MNDAKLRQWLLDTGGLAIRMNLVSEHNSEVSKLLYIERVKTVLSYLDGFKVKERDKRTLEHLIHYYKESCIDNFFPLLMGFGFRAGMPVFDKKMESVRKIFMDLIEINDSYGYNFRLMMHQFFFKAGYDHGVVVESMVQRLEKLHISAKEKTFEIYQSGDNLPKPPAQWTDRGILKDDLNPFSKEATRPLPTIYDIKALSHFPVAHTTPAIRTMIDNVITYILEPEFQEIPEGYGLLWAREIRRYHSCGWSPTLPCWHGIESDRKPPSKTIVGYLEIMSRFSKARSSKWYIKCLKYLDRYRTQSGTYLFPKEFLGREFGRRYDEKAFLNDDSLKLKKNERQAKVCELVSTLKMIKIRSLPEIDQGKAN